MHCNPHEYWSHTSDAVSFFASASELKSQIRKSVSHLWQLAAALKAFGHRASPMPCWFLRLLLHEPGVIQADVPCSLTGAL